MRAKKKHKQDFFSCSFAVQIFVLNYWLNDKTKEKKKQIIIEEQLKQTNEIKRKIRILLAEMKGCERKYAVLLRYFQFFIYRCLNERRWKTGINANNKTIYLYFVF